MESKKGLSAGRTISSNELIVDREKEIETFEPEEYWSIEAEFLKNETVFEGQFYGENGKKQELKTEADVKEIINN